jgi:hypothetical protein
MSQDSSKVESHGTVEKGAAPSRLQFGKPLLVLFGIVGSIASVVSIPLAIYFYQETKQAPMLTYYIHPARAVVVKAGQASKLTVDFANKEVKGDITAVQVAIWNQGNSSIKKGGILKPIILQTENNAPILEATIRKISRDVINLSLDNGQADKGRVTLSWDILERNDGGIIQLIYIGGTDTAISMDGVIEGQSRILQLQSSIALRSPEEQLRSERRGNKLLGWALVSFAGLIAIPIITLFVWSLKTKTFKLRQDWVLLVSPFLFLVLGMYLLSKAQEVGPPFGF